MQMLIVKIGIVGMRMVEIMDVITSDRNSGFTDNQRVKYVASSFINKALTWWNTQVQARGREATNGMTWEEFEALLVEEFYPSNEMERCVTLSKGSEKRKEVEESSKQGGWGNDHKRAKVGKGFVAAAPLRNEYAGPYSKCTKCFAYHSEGAACRVCINCQKSGHLARDYRMPVKQVAPINVVRGEHKPGTCYECGSRENFQNTCPKLNRAPGQVGNRLTIEGNQNIRNNKSQARGRAFNVNVVGALQDPKVMAGTFSLNDHFATVLFDSRADFSFVSTKFMSLLNVKPSIVTPGYVIEVADGKNVKVDRIIRGCKLELGNSLFTIDLGSLGYGIFDVIVGMDWLSEHKAMIVCHEKLVRIPLATGEMLRIYGVKENQEKDKIGSKPDKNRKRVEAEKSLKQLQW
nr:putative reverse transcriptase domain-containing protein [Tanacetum cinerariifolium]